MRAKEISPFLYFYFYSFLVGKRQDTVCLTNLSDGVMVIMVSGFSLLDIKINNNKNIACWVRILK